MVYWYGLKRRKIIKVSLDLCDPDFFLTFQYDKHIKQNKIGGFLISTVFLGADHKMRGLIPVLFETAVNNGEGWDIVSRYRTLAEARKGHKLTRKGVIAHVTEIRKMAQRLRNKRR